MSRQEEASGHGFKEGDILIASVESGRYSQWFVREVVSKQELIATPIDGEGNFGRVESTLSGPPLKRMGIDAAATRLYRLLKEDRLRAKG